MRTLNDYFITAEIVDISTASSTFVPVPDGGKIISATVTSGGTGYTFGKVSVDNITGDGTGNGGQVDV